MFCFPEFLGRPGGKDLNKVIRASTSSGVLKRVSSWLIGSFNRSAMCNASSRDVVANGERGMKRQLEVLGNFSSNIFQLWLVHLGIWFFVAQKLVPHVDHSGFWFIFSGDQLIKPIHSKQDEAHEPECRHVCWQTETILICHISSKLTHETPWVHTLKWHSCGTPLLDTIAQRSGETLLWDTLVRHFLLDTLVRHSYLTFLKDTLPWHSYLTPL